MNGWVDAARSVMNRTPTRALPLTRLLEELRAEGIVTAGREEWILRVLAEHPEIFRVVSSGLGPWAGASRDPWILLKEDPPTFLGPVEEALLKLRASLQVWGRALDGDSPSAVARWIRANLEGEGIYRTLRRGGFSAV